MALTRDFRETIRDRPQQEPKFRKALLCEAIELMLSGDEKAGRAILRNTLATTSTLQSVSGSLCQYRLKITHSAGRKMRHPPEKMVYSFSRLTENRTGW
jgi:hypothetical protein